ncbi:hypothetical protein TNCV_4787881 [Trichonephila clavipes]|nr:hypothetical protein TNCV_4787881 [Trichonephila clavipes]
MSPSQYGGYVPRLVTEWVRVRIPTSKPEIKCGGHRLGKERLITRSSVKCWSNSAFADTWIWKGAPSCMKMVDVRTHFCCSSGTTNVCSMSWYRRPVTEHVTRSRSLISSKKNVPRTNIAMNPHQKVTFRDCIEISAWISRFSLAQMWQFYELNVTKIEMSLVAPQNTQGHDR